MRLALLCLLVGACAPEPTFVLARVSMSLETDNPEDATFQNLELYAYQQTHMHGDTTRSVDVDLHLEIDGLELPVADFDTLAPDLRGYPGGIFVLADDERKPLGLVPFFTARVEVSETAYLVTFDPPVGDGEQAWLGITTSTGHDVIPLPIGATTGEAPRANVGSLSLTRSASTAEDLEGLRISGSVNVARTLVTRGLP